MTKYEKMILEIVNESHDHMTSEEIYLALKAKESKVVLATVYNNLKKLSDEGKIIKLRLNDHSERYDKNTRHDHLICSKCGKIKDFSFSNLTEKLQQELGEQIGGYDLRIQYVCPECREN